jgi:hypothetical protein
MCGVPLLPPTDPEIRTSCFLIVSCGLCFAIFPTFAVAYFGSSDSSAISAGFSLSSSASSFYLLDALFSIRHLSGSFLKLLNFESVSTSVLF